MLLKRTWSVLMIAGGCATATLGQHRTPAPVVDSPVKAPPAESPAMAPGPPSTPPASAPDAPSTAPATTAPRTFAERGERVLLAAEESGDLEVAKAAIAALMDEVISTSDLATAQDHADLREVARASRLIAQLHQAGPTDRKGLLTLARERRAFSTELVFLLDPADDANAAWQVAQRLDRARGKSVDDFASLAAALCVVHDVPIISQASGRTVDPLALFDYFTQIDQSSIMGVRRMPAELLIFVVNSRADIPELHWAWSRHRTDRQVGRRFFDITYDTEHFKRGSPKKIDKLPYTLENLRKVGGICADQAYYAEHVAKAIGVPSVTVTAPGSVTGHAWVGFLELVSPGRVEWNFDHGRYKEYKGLRGDVRNPQTGKPTSDTAIQFRALAATATPQARLTALALADGARRLWDAVRGSEKLRTPAGATPRREATVVAALELSKAAVTLCPATPRAWLDVAEFAERGWMTEEQIVEWSNALARLCGPAYADFGLDVLTPMTRGLTNRPARQIEMWEWVFDTYVRSVSDQRYRRNDIAARVRFEQAKVWERAGDLAQAWACYQRVINEHPDDGRLIVEAVSHAEKMLTDHGKTAADVLALYKHAWSRAKKPSGLDPDRALIGNWGQIGIAYADRLEAANRLGDAKAVRTQLGFSAIEAKKARQKPAPSGTP